MVSTRMSTKENEAWDTILNGHPRDVLSACVEMKVVAKKFLPWLENIEKDPRSNALANLYSEISLLQVQLRKKYKHATTTGS
jgi:hypothetical protein